jgi:hypothetical protein
MRVVRLGLLSVAMGLVLSLCVSVLLVAAAHATSSAHPLGNFTVNHYNGLRISASDVRNHAVVDLAELPTLQVQPQVDAAYAGRRCAALAAAQRLRVSGRAVPWRVSASSFAYAPGQGGLRTSRLTCRLVAEVHTAGAVEFTDGFEQDRIGWREIIAIGDGVRLTRSSVPATSVSDELRSYPGDLLADPLDQRTATMTVSGLGGLPAPGNSGAPGGAVPGGIGRGGIGLGGIGIGGPIGDALAALDRTFTGLIAPTR